MSTPSTEQRELDLVEKLDFRILRVANNDRKLQELLNTFLAPLVLKGGSEYAAVRAKVANVLHRLKTFIGPPGVVLPVAALVAQFKKTDSAVVRHLDVIFIQHSIGRLDAKDRRAVLPALLTGIARVNMSTPALFSVVLQALAVQPVPPRGSAEDAAFASTIGLTDAADAQYVADRFGEIFLLSRTTAEVAENGNEPAPHAVFFGFQQAASIPAGTGSAGAPMTWLRMGTNLADTRIRVAQFLASGAFTDGQRFMAALYAAGHKDGRVSAAGEEMLKRSTVSLEDPAVVAQLYAAHASRSIAHRIRILGLLSRSAMAARNDLGVLSVMGRDLRATEAYQDRYRKQLEHGAAAITSEPEPDQYTLEPDLNQAMQTMVARGLQSVRLVVADSLELAKLHRAVFSFLTWVARVQGKGADSPIGRTVLQCVWSYIMSQGFPAPVSEAMPALEELRAQAYETLGAVALSARLGTTVRLHLVTWLFQALSEDTVSAVVVNIDGAVSGLTSLFPRDRASGATEAQLESFKILRRMLVHYMDLAERSPRNRRSVRHATVKFTNRCLPFSDPLARWIDIVAVAGRPGERSDVVEEGLKGLDPWTYYANGGAIEPPDWTRLIPTFFPTPVEVAAIEPPDPVKFATREAYAVGVAYCKRMLVVEALPTFAMEPGWEAAMETVVRSDPATRAVVRQYLLEANADMVARLLAAAIDGMMRGAEDVARGDAGGAATGEMCGAVFAELAPLASRQVVSGLTNRTKMLLPVVASNRRELRAFGAATVGIVGGHPSNEAAGVMQMQADLVAAARPWQTAVGAERNVAEGAFVALGRLWSRLVLYGRGNMIDGMEVLPTAAEVAAAPASLQDSMMEAMSELWTLGMGVGRSEAAAFETVLGNEAKKGNERAITALGRLAMGGWEEEEEWEDEEEDGGDTSDDVAMSDANEAEGGRAEAILETLFGLYDIKQVEVHFTVGAAITAAVARWDSEAVALTLDVEVEEDAPFLRRARPQQVAWALERILRDCAASKPAVLKAAALWLFSMVQYCGQLAAVQARLRAVQAAFVRLLGARDELVQETAARGLALVYERGDADLRKALVADLVGAFTGGGTTTTTFGGGRVEADTELFEAGALPTGETSMAGSGSGSGSGSGNSGSITSYRDIVQLANEVGDQSLVYKFMALAANAATWSTRSAFGRFGLDKLLAQGEVDPRLYPKLFRYRFDPNANVRRSMEAIWRALVPHAGALVATHFDAILADLLASVLGREWRVREASCAALAELLQGRPFGVYADRYEEIWGKALKVLDDVKASVRAAALKLCGGLANTLVRQVEAAADKGEKKEKKGEKKEEKKEGEQDAMDVDHTDQTDSALAIALPFLLHHGIESGVEDVRLFATVTLVQIAQHGGRALRPYAASMVVPLLGLLSTVEPQAVNYYYQRSAEDTREKLDKLRSTMVAQSPISEAIEDCLRHVDAAGVAALVPALEATMQTAVGLPTHLGCGRVLATLATRHGPDLAPHAPRLLRALGRHLLDRNDEASQGYARAAAYVVRVAPAAACTDYAGGLVDLYLGADSDTTREKTAAALLALATVSPDAFAGLATSLLPLAFVAARDADERVRQAAEAVWAKHAGGDRSVARYVPEIAALAQRGLDTAQWALRHAAALATADAVAGVLAAGRLSGQVSGPQLQALWPLYARALGLKTFAGKERVLAVLPELVSKGRPWWAADAAVAAALHRIPLVEARRTNAAYRVHAFACLWQVAAAAGDDTTLWPSAVAIVRPFLEAYAQGERDGSAMDVDADKTDKTAAELRRATAEGAVDVVARAYSRPALARDPRAVLAAVLAELGPCLAQDSFALVRRTTWFKAATDLLAAAEEAQQTKEALETNETNEAHQTTETAETTEADDGALALAYLASLDVAHADVGTEAQRAARAKAVAALVQATKQGVFGPGQTAALEAMQGALRGALAEERSMEVQKLLKGAM